MRRTFTYLAIGICFAILCALSSGCSKAKGNLAFVGKPAASGASFVFTLTNSGGSTIVYLTCQPQVQSGGAWSDAPLNPQTNRTIATLLSPRQSSKVTIATPVGGAPWRLAVLWAQIPTLNPWQRVELAAQRIFSKPNRGLPVTMYTNFSAEITP